MIKFGLKLGLLGIMGAALMGCSEGTAQSKTSDTSKAVATTEKFVSEYLLSRFNGADISFLGAPRKGFRIPVIMGENDLNVVGLDIPKIVRTPQYTVYPSGGPFEFPNAIWADHASAEGLRSLQTFAIGAHNVTSSEWLIGKDAAFDFGTYVDGSLKKGANICSPATDAYTAKIKFSNKIDQTKKAADVAVCVSYVRVEGGVSAKRMPYIQTVILGIS